MIRRFGDNGQMREALLRRAWLPASARAALAAASARCLTELAVELHWLRPTALTASPKTPPTAPL